MNENFLNAGPLGKKSRYINTYTPSLLFPIPRKLKRDELGLQIGQDGKLPFAGYDLWNGFELSWLNLKGKPVVALGEFIFPCESHSIIESKSFKLYLNSFNQSKFESFAQVSELMRSDLSLCVGSAVSVRILPLSEGPRNLGTLTGVCLDDLDVECTLYTPAPHLLGVSEADVEVEERVYTNLLKSNCLVTGQPDWGSLQVEYSGRKINPEGLLKYIVSMRDHNEFHEQCVERIFNDLQKACHPRWLTVYAQYTRRGGLDISPLRTNRPGAPVSIRYRLVRQ